MRRSRSFKVQLGLGLMALILVLFDYGMLSHPMKRLDGVFYDELIRLTSHQKTQATPVVVIDIDDKSILKEGRWPWPRDKLAELVVQLKKAGAVVIALDIVISEPEINYALGLREKLSHGLQNKVKKGSHVLKTLSNIAPFVDNDKTLAKALEHNEVVLGVLFHHDQAIQKGALPAPLKLSGNPINLQKLTTIHFQGYNGVLPLFLKAARYSGFISNKLDEDGAIRRGLLLASYDNKLYASLVLSTVMRYLLVDEIAINTYREHGLDRIKGLRVGGIWIPTNEFGEMLIPFYGLPGTMDTYSATDIMQHQLPDKALAGSIAVVGSTLALLADNHQVPLSQSFPGVELTANMISGILSKQVSSAYLWTMHQGLVVFLCLGLFFACLFPLLNPMALLFVSLLVGPLLFACSYALLVHSNVYVPIARLFALLFLQASLNFIYDFVLERRQKRTIEALFGQYVSSSYVKQLTDFPERTTMQGETRDMTVCFIDIRGFTEISEILDAGELKRLLNTFFTPITEIIFRHQGTIDKYVGDMVMAFWGAPLMDLNQVSHGIEAALDIHAHLGTINQRLCNEALPAVNIGIGLSSGPMNVGDMGSTFRRSYTVIGDHVNLASRLQDLTKFYQVDILVNETTRKGQDAFLWRTIDKVKVKGRHAQVTIYEPVGMLQDLKASVIAEVSAYEEALHAYHHRDWSGAKSQFEALLQKNPCIYLYKLYLKRVMKFSQNPPPMDWEGVYVHTHK